MRALKQSNVAKPHLPFAVGRLDRDATRVKLTARDTLTAKTARTPFDIYHSGIVNPPYYPPLLDG